MSQSHKTQAEVSVCVLTAADAGRLLAHFAELGSADRRLRFGQTVRDEILERYVCSLWTTKHIVYAIEDGLGNVVAAGHLAFSRKSLSAEIGLSVTEGFRGRGYARTLLKTALSAATDRGTEDVVLHFMAENRAMARLCAKQGALFEGDYQDARALFQLRPSTKLAPRITAQDIARGPEADLDEYLSGNPTAGGVRRTRLRNLLGNGWRAVRTKGAAWAVKVKSPQI